MSYLSSYDLFRLYCVVSRHFLFLSNFRLFLTFLFAKFIIKSYLYIQSWFLATINIIKHISKLVQMEVDQSTISNVETVDIPSDTPVQYIYNDSRSRLYVAFHESSTLHFIGCIRVRVLYGSLKVHGSILSPDGKYSRICSTATHPTYVTHSTAQFADCPYKDIQSLEEFLFAARTNSKYGMSETDSERILFKLSEVDELNFVSLCLIKSASIPIAFLTRKRFKNLFQPANSSPILPFFYPLKTAKSLLTPKVATHWESIIDNISKRSSPKVLVCGPKGAGKSTFSLYLSNYLLNTHQAVFYIECDPGQPEFLPTGTLGVQALTKPKLGPAYTHKLSSEMNYFFGSTTPSSNPRLYIDIIMKMLDSVRLLYNEEVDIPIIINSCGWVEGLGIGLLADIISLSRPSVIIAKYIADKSDWCSNLGSTQINRNRIYTRGIENPPYTVEVMKCSIDEITTEYVPSKETCLLYPMKSFLSSVTPLVKTPGFSPIEFRTLSLITYFSKNLKFNSPFNYLEEILFQCPLYAISIQNFLYQKVSVDFPNSHLLEVLNANIIGLGEVNADSSLEEVSILGENIKFLGPTEICTCLGLGFVRYINEKEKKLIVTTPVKSVNLKKVNVIMIGSHTLCQSFYLLRKLDESSFYTLKSVKTKSKATKHRKANKQLKTPRSFSRPDFHKLL